MRKAILFPAILLTLLALPQIRVPAQQKYLSVSLEEAARAFEGIWVNMQMPGLKLRPHKLVITSDGRVDHWLSVSYLTLSGTYRMVEAWRDEEGNLYCTVDRQTTGEGITQELWKLGQSSTRLEYNCKMTKGEEYPMEIDRSPDPSKSPRIYYGVWYRQCEAAQESVSSRAAIKALAGTWINTKMSGLKHYTQKLVIASDGKIEVWLSTSYITVRQVLNVVSSWRDPEGDLYCTADVQTIGETSDQYLWKLSESGNTLEANHKMTRGEPYPKQIDRAPDLTKLPRIYYGIWYRQ
jgi:hypothetical protein